MPLIAPPSWSDHFLGIAIDPRYRILLGPVGDNPAAGPQVGIAQGTSVADMTSVGGRVLMETQSAIQTNARIRFGEEPDGGIDVRNWDIHKNAKGESRVAYNSNNFIQMSVGFVGAYDPSNYCEMYYVAPGDAPSTWYFFTKNFAGGNAGYYNTGFTHQPNVPFTFRVELEWNDGKPSVDILINDVVVLKDIRDPQIPITPLCWEWNIFNFPKFDGYSNSAVWIDWLHLEQDH